MKFKIQTVAKSTLTTKIKLLCIQIMLCLNYAQTLNVEYLCTTFCNSC